MASPSANLNNDPANPYSQGIPTTAEAAPDLYLGGYYSPPNTLADGNPVATAGARRGDAVDDAATARMQADAGAVYSAARDTLTYGSSPSVRDYLTDENIAGTTGNG